MTTGAQAATCSASSMLWEACFIPSNLCSCVVWMHSSHDATLQAEMTDDDWAAMMRDNNVEEVAPQMAPAPTPAAAGPPPGFEHAKAAPQADSQVLACSRGLRRICESVRGPKNAEARLCTDSGGRLRRLDLRAWVSSVACL